MGISITTKSYPYLAFSQDWDIPYWVVLSYGDNSIWGDLADEWLDQHLSRSERASFDATHANYKRVATTPTKEPAPN